MRQLSLLATTRPNWLRSWHPSFCANPWRNLHLKKLQLRRLKVFQNWNTSSLSIGKIMWICIESLNRRGTTLNMKQQNIIERILEDVQQLKSSARKPRTVPYYAHILAIKIQAAYRGYRVLDPTMRPSIKEL
ncbi:uncharacterized protein LOC122049382 isoform X1 [Zingiber officinale]|uniref:uncharacterized protein LOC122049382 isoform X1 n=1 Tax=Zingiber officinale TaxID=94328 RepID=UPI001C4D5079|nr:uncharacterized protein LOC122049382 isoform X1 [Zingiber officinale]